MSVTYAASFMEPSGDGDTAVISLGDTTGRKGIAVWVSCQHTVTPTVADNKSNAYTAGPEFVQGSGMKGKWFYTTGTPTVGSGHTVTVTATSGFPTGYAVTMNATGSPTFDQSSAGGGTTSGTTVQGGSFTPGEDGALALAGVATDKDIETGYTIDSPFTIRQQNLEGGSNYGGGIATFDQTTAAALNPTWTADANVQYMAARNISFVESGGGGTAAVTGTLDNTPSLALRTTSGKTIVLTLTGDTFIGSFTNTDKLNILNGVVAAVTQTNGWNNERDTIDHTTAVARTSSTACTITLPAMPTVVLGHDDILEATIPGSVLTGGSPIVATPTIAIRKKEPDAYAKVLFRL